MQLNKTQSFSVTFACHETLPVWDYFVNPDFIKGIYFVNHVTELYYLYYLVHLQTKILTTYWILSTNILRRLISHFIT